MGKFVCYYKVLGVDVTAEKEEIRKAFIRETLRWHPDKNTEDTTEKFRLVAEAHRVLSDDQLRAEHDSRRAAHLETQKYRRRRTGRVSSSPTRPRIGREGSPEGNLPDGDIRIFTSFEEMFKMGGGSTIFSFFGGPRSSENFGFFEEEFEVEDDDGEEEFGEEEEFEEFEDEDDSFFSFGSPFEGLFGSIGQAFFTPFVGSSDLHPNNTQRNNNKGNFNKNKQSSRKQRKKKSNIQKNHNSGSGNNQHSRHNRNKFESSRERSREHSKPRFNKEKSKQHKRNSKKTNLNKSFNRSKTHFKPTKHKTSFFKKSKSSKSFNPPNN